MFRSQQRKRKILFGLSDVVLTAAAFELAYGFRRWLPLSNEFFLLPEVKDLLLCFSVLAWVTSGYWLNVYSSIDALRIRAIQPGRSSMERWDYSCLLFSAFVFAIRSADRFSPPSFSPVGCSSSASG